MQEILPGLWHWQTFRDTIQTTVSSYYVEPAAALIDPIVEEGGLDWFKERETRPEHVILTIGLHLRSANEFAEEFGCVIRASQAAADRIGDEAQIRTFTDGEEVAPGITAFEIGVLAPDESALHISGVDKGALSFADGLMRYGGSLGFVPDEFMGGDPAVIKPGLRDAYTGLLDREFDHLLFAHGDPLIGGGKAALRELLESA